MPQWIRLTPSIYLLPALAMILSGREIFGSFQQKEESGLRRIPGSERRLIEYPLSQIASPIPSTFATPAKENHSSPHHCKTGYFECKNHPELCIPQAGICNNKQECPDNSDEENCRNTHDDRFYDHLFRPRHNKDTEFTTDDICKYPNVTLIPGNELIEIQEATHTEDEIIEELGLYTSEGCECFWEKFICQNLELKDLSGVPMELEDLDLSGSTVESLDFNSPHGFSHLRHLILSSCNIAKLYRGSFYKLHSLETLHLTDNQLQRIPNGTFLGLFSLRKLFIGHNKITTIEPGGFEDLSMLLELWHLEVHALNFNNILEHESLTICNRDIRHNLIARTGNIFSALKSLRILDLSHNMLQVIAAHSFNGLKMLQVLSIASNGLTSIQKDSFVGLSGLKTLYLSWNKLKTLESRGFCNLHSLLDLRLNENQLVHIDSYAFSCLDSLQSMNLAGNQLGELPNGSTIFENLTTLEHIRFDQYWMCSFAMHVRACFPKGDGISSQDNLLDNLALRISFWIMGLVGVFGNIFVIASRLILREPNRIHSFYIKNLAVGDLLMGIFLLSIAIHDQKFRGNFLRHQHVWRHSTTCQFSGLLGTWSSEASVLILTLITMDRYFSISRPFADKVVSLTPAILIAGAIWVVSFLLSYVPLFKIEAVQNYFGNFYASNGLCFPLQIHPYEAGSGYEFSILIFIVFFVVSFVFITYAYWQMLRIIQTSALRIRSNQLNQDGILAKRFGLIVLTNFLCWAPVIAAKIVAMAGVAVHQDLYAWLAICVSINSALNPLIYTLSTKLFLQQITKTTTRIQKRLTRRRASEDSSISLSVFNRLKAQRRQTMTTSVQNSLRCATGVVQPNLQTTVGNDNGISQIPQHTTRANIP